MPGPSGVGNRPTPRSGAPANSTLTWKDRVVLVLLWLLFVGLWFRVYRVTTVSDVVQAGVLLSSLIAAYCVVVGSWVFHNIAIYRRKGPRTGVRMVRYSSIHDRLGHYLRYQTDLKRTQAIVVDVAGNTKVFAADDASSRGQKVS